MDQFKDADDQIRLNEVKVDLLRWQFRKTGSIKEGCKTATVFVIFAENDEPTKISSLHSN